MSAVQLLTEHLALWSSADTEKKSGRGRASGNAANVYGVKKLRELILELAVRGKLVPQDANDEPASELLKRIAAEKAKLITDGKIRKGKPFASVSEKEMIFELPSGWEWVRLGSIGDWGAGATPSRSVSSYYGGEIPWFKSGELAMDFIDSSEETVTDLALKDCSLRLNQPDDVLIAMYGATIGKTSILRVQGTTNQAVCACTPNTGIFNRYLLTLLKAMRANFIGQGAGGAQPNISREKIIATPFALPPTLEQHRIVAKVDELMALCDQLENQHTDAIAAHERLVSYLLDTLTQSKDAADFNESWQRIAANFEMLFTTELSIDALKQTLLQLAVMGKLVPQDASDEPASELLKRIQVEKAKLISEGKIKKSKPLADVSDEEKSLVLPKGWVWTRWDTIALKIGDIDHKMPEQVTEGYPYVSPRDFYPNNRIDFDGAKKISKSDFLVLSAKIQPKRGDIIYPRYGTIGENRLVETDVDFLASYSCAVIKTMHDFISPEYQFIYSVSNFVKNQAKAAENKTTQANVGIKSIQNYVYPLPPLPEQYRIVAKVDELLKLCDTLKSRISVANQIQRKVADVMVEQAVA